MSKGKKDRLKDICRYQYIYQYRSHKIFITSINLFIIIFFSFPVIAYGQEQITQQQSEIIKLKKDIESLKQQTNKNVDIGYELLKQGLALIGIAGGAGAAAFFAWQRERRIPPPAEQEQIIENIVKQWYSQGYLLIYGKIWDEIQKSENNSEHLVDLYYEILSRKRFDWQKFPEIKQKVEDPPKEYLKKKLHLNDEEIVTRKEAVENNADVEYYREVETILPSVIDIAVTSAIGNSTNLDGIDYEVLVENSLKATKRLMIFYRLAEDKKVVEILIRAKVCEKIQEWKKK
jgi:hypothetical protein